MIYRKNILVLPRLVFSFVYAGTSWNILPTLVIEKLCNTLWHIETGWLCFRIQIGIDKKTI